MTETTPASTSVPTADQVPAGTTPAVNPYLRSEQPATAATSSSNGFSIASLVLGIVSIPTGLAVAAIVAIVLGFVARTREPAGRTMALWGIVTGFVGLFGWVLAAIFGVLIALPFLSLVPYVS